LSRISRKFEELHKATRKGFIPYITAGDPSLRHTSSILDALIRAGSDLVEIGVPFSDPLADGPVIQRASERSLLAGTTVAQILETISDFRTARRSKRGDVATMLQTADQIEEREIPLILFSYLNPIWQMGIENFARQAKQAGVDGVLLTDLIPEESAAIQKVFDAQGLDLIFLIAPTSTDERIRKICRAARGFVYAISRTGTTGTRESLSQGIEAFVARIRQHTTLPIAVGFGISTHDQVQTVWRVADAAVVGSAIVKLIEGEIGLRSSISVSERELATKVEEFVRGLIAGT
jgi:tryptophan synthase alpha chain